MNDPKRGGLEAILVGAETPWIVTVDEILP
jgi:hypothetical protein